MRVLKPAAGKLAPADMKPKESQALTWLRFLLACAAVLSASPAFAGGLQVEPVLLELDAPVAASFLTLHNGNDKEMSVQTRVFRWRQTNGAEDLQPTEDVAVSPPIVTIPAGADYTVRVVRTATAEVRGEESYRLWVDELPDERRNWRAGLNILIRQSIPVFFRAPDLAAPSIDWSARLVHGQVQVTAQNSGDEHVRLASLSLRDTPGNTASFGRGLVGYVLGHASMTFTIPHPPRGFGAGGAVSIMAQGTSGTLDATAPLQILP
jgi:fimbrial chaperone protein